MAKEIVNENPCTPDKNTEDSIGKVAPEQEIAQAIENRLALCDERSMPLEFDIAEEVRRLADRLCGLTRDTNYFTRVKSYHDEIYKQNIEAERRISANLANVVCVRISNLVHLLYAKNCEKFPELAPKVQQEQPKAPAADGKPENVTRFNPKKDGRVCN